MITYQLDLKDFEDLTKVFESILLKELDVHKENVTVFSSKKYIIGLSYRLITDLGYDYNILNLEKDGNYNYKMFIKNNYINITPITETEYVDDGNVFVIVNDRYIKNESYEIINDKKINIYGILKIQNDDFIKITSDSINGQAGNNYEIEQRELYLYEDEQCLVKNSLKSTNVKSIIEFAEDNNIKLDEAIK